MASVVSGPPCSMDEGIAQHEQIGEEAQRAKHKYRTPARLLALGTDIEQADRDRQRDKDPCLHRQTFPSIDEELLETVEHFQIISEESHVSRGPPQSASANGRRARRNGRRAP